MIQPRPICLSLTPNLRCIGFTLDQLIALVIPPAIELALSFLFFYSYSGPARRSQFLLVTDGILYFIWALLDVLSYVVPAARSSLSLFKALDLFVGAVSFTPIFIYSIYLYRLCFRNFIPTFTRKFQPYLEFSVFVLLVIAVAVNELSSFVGIYFAESPNRSFVVMFSDNSESLWLALTHASLTIYTIIQFLLFLVAFSRLSRAFLDQRRIELTHSNDHRYFRGIPWVTTAIVVGVVETIAGFAQVSFGVALARRTLRLVARAVLMSGLLKGLDDAENFETLPDELGGVPRITKHISRILGFNTQQAGTFRRISQSFSEQFASAEKQARGQHVTIHHEKGQAPFLQIRFSALDIPTQAILADTIQQRRRSLSGLIPVRANAGSSTQRYKENLSDEIVATRYAMLDAPKAKSAPATDNGCAPPDWIWPPERNRSRTGSGATIPDNLSVVRDLERRFPNLPPRVTGRYRGSILGQNYEEDPFPVVGVSRQSSLRRDGPSEEGGGSTTLSPSSSIKRKPAPPLLDNIALISDRRNHLESTWGGLTPNPVNCRVDSPVVSSNPIAYSPDSTQGTEPCTPRSRRTIARNLINRVSRAMSEASIRSAEWLASASSPQSGAAPLTLADIEMYRRGHLGPSRPTPAVDDVSLFGDNILPVTRRRSADDVNAHSDPNWPWPASDRESTHTAIIHAYAY